MSVVESPTEASLRDHGLVVPPAHSILSLADRPELRSAVGDFNAGAWPDFMLEDRVANRLWHHLFEDFAPFQLVLLDAVGQIAAAGNSAPLAWDGTDDGLPEGWDDQFERTVADLVAGRAPTTLGALQIVVDPARRGTGLAGVMIEAMRANARAHGLSALIACVRPTSKDRYPATPIETYAAWVRADGQPFDPWIRLHVRAGGRIVRAAPHSMTIRGSVAEWESWTGMAFPESGDHVLEGGAATVHIDREADEGVYHDPNVWIVHDLAREGSAG